MLSDLLPTPYQRRSQTVSHIWISRREGRLHYIFSNELLSTVEQMYIVWSGGNRKPRFRTPAYRICAVVVLGYVAIVVLTIIGQNSWIRTDGMCFIGLKNFAYVRVPKDIAHFSCTTDRFP